MAQTLCIQGADERLMNATRRSPAAPALLPFITFGIYYLYWHYAVNRELCDLGRTRGIRGLGTAPGVSLLAVTFGWVLILPPFVSHIQTTRRIKKAQRAVGLSPMSSFLAILLGFFFWPARPAYIQSELNGLWTVAAGASAFIPQMQPVPVGHWVHGAPVGTPVALLPPPAAEALVQPMQTVAMAAPEAPAPRGL